MISVKKEMPPEGKNVLVFVAMPTPPCGEFDIGARIDGEWTTHKYHGEITHWQGLPDVPEEKQ